MVEWLGAIGGVAAGPQRDGRLVKRVYLTPGAERGHKRIWRVAEATVEDALTGLSAQESRQLMTLLQRIKKTLVSAVDGGPPGKTVVAGRKPALGGARGLNGKTAPCASACGHGP